MGSFGKAGNREDKTDIQSVMVRISQKEFIVYTLTVDAGEPIFTFSCEHRALWSADNDPGHPKKTYTWKWSKNDFGDDAPNPIFGDVYGVRMVFTAASKYVLLVEYHDKDGGVHTLKDITYTSSNPKDWFQEELQVFAS
jgi:hypothetical protein